MPTKKKEKLKLIDDEMGKLSLISMGFILAGLYGLNHSYLSDKDHIIQRILRVSLAISFLTLIVALFINRRVIKSVRVENIISRLEHLTTIIWVDIGCLYFYLSKDDVIFSFGKTISSFRLVYDVDSSLTLWYIVPLAMSTLLCLILFNLPKKLISEERLADRNKRLYLSLSVFIISLCIMLLGQLVFGKFDGVSLLGAFIALLVTWTNL